MTQKPVQPRGLGRGLSALMADLNVDAGAVPGAGPARRPDGVVPVERLRPNPNQPRRHYAPEALEDLAASIRAKGVLQPLIVRPVPGTADFEIVAGERRWRAAQIAQVHEVPVLIRDFDDTEVLEVAIVENIQRADLNAMEEAAAYRQLMDRFGHTQERLAEALSKSRSHIANLLRLLSLPEDVQDHLRSGRLSAGHARALITTGDASALARRVIAEGLSVRQTEQMVKKPGPAHDRGRRTAEKDADTRSLEADLSAQLGMTVAINHDEGSGSGVMILRYRSLEDLDRLCRVLSVSDPDGSR